MKNKNSSCKLLLAMVLTICCVQSGRAGTPLQFNIAPQALTEALIKYSEQSGIQVSSPSRVVAGKASSGVVGEFSAAEALTRLLGGTGLAYDFIDSTTVAVRAPSAPDSNQKASYSRDRKPLEGMTLAENAGAIAVNAEDAQEKSSAENPVQKRPESDRAGARESSEEEVLVTGTHIRGPQELAAPTIVFTREDIENTGYARLESLFEELPQNFDSVSFDGVLGERMLGAGDNRADRAAGINLRGLGSGSTLTLLNGMRRAASVNGTSIDISLIPLSVIERVEIVTGGRSAIYGSDAVGGVVNLMTRRDYSGFETQLQYTTTADDAEEIQASAITGLNFQRGGLVLAYDFQDTSRLDLLATGLYNSPIPVTNITMISNDIRPDSWRHSGFLSGRFSLTDRIELHADGLFTRRQHNSEFRQIFPGGASGSFQLDETNNDTYSAALGATIDLSDEWTLDVAANASATQKEFRGVQHFDLGFLVIDNNNIDDTTATLTGFSAVANGALPAWGSITPRAAFGIEVRDEELERRQIIGNINVYNYDRDRSVNSAFAELLIPIGGGGRKSVDLSLAGRYDDYNDFGDTFNPEFGIIWRPLERLTVRSAYSTAFRAPALSEMGTASFVGVDRLVDTNGTLVPVLTWTGENPDLKPELATAWSLGLDFEPAWLPSSRVSLSYFDIDYEDRIGVPAGGADFALVLQREARFGGLINRAPTAAQALAIIQSDSDGFVGNTTGTPYTPATILTTFPNLVVFDNRSANVAVETVRGFDLAVQSAFETDRGMLDTGLNVTYSLEHERNVTATSPSFTLLNETGRPVDLRVRANAGWTTRTGAYGASLYLNYVDSYLNPLVTPALEMSSWTTLDLSLRVNGAALSKSNWLSGLSAQLSIDNVLDKDPPALLGGFAGGGYRYDAANASALGRVISVRLVQRWK